MRCTGMTGDSDAAKKARCPACKSFTCGLEATSDRAPAIRELSCTDRKLGAQRAKAASLVDCQGGERSVPKRSSRGRSIYRLQPPFRNTDATKAEHRDVWELRNLCLAQGSIKSADRFLTTPQVSFRKHRVVLSFTIRTMYSSDALSK